MPTATAGIRAGANHSRPFGAAPSFGPAAPAVTTGTGTTATTATAKAETVAKGIEGVKSVKNNLTVAAASGGNRNAAPPANTKKS